MKTYNRKDKNPIETINNIKQILKSLGIKIKELPIKCINNSYYSIRIEIKGFYNIGSNGKGISKEFAKASAYAELMERLQSRMLIRNYFLNKTTNPMQLKSKLIANENLDCFYSGNDITNLKNFLNNKKEFNYLDTFIDLHTNKEILLPIKLIGATCHSNGLCAGNSYYEAVSQGIGEILERHAYKTILKTTPILNNIEIDSSIDCIKEIKSLTDLNFKVTIKDCSLDNTFPVIGVLIQNENEDKYIFALASDTNINIAIQRCITEICQGLNSKDELLNKMKPFDNAFDKLSLEEKKINWLKCYSSNNGLHPSYIFESKKTINYKNLTIFNAKNTNKEVYDDLLKILENASCKVYVKDYSKTNFNTYRVYIPSLTEIDKLDDDDLLLLSHYNEIESLYFNIDKKISDTSLNNIENVFFNIIKKEKYKFMNMGEYFHSKDYINTNYNNISFELFYGLLCIKNNHSSNIENIKSVKIKEYLNSVISLNLNDPISYIFSSLNIKNIKCLDCKKCKLKRKCCFKNWSKINDNLLKLGI